MTGNPNYVYDPTELKSLIGREQGRPALLIGGGLSARASGHLHLSLSIRHKLWPVIIALNGCNTDPTLAPLIDYDVRLECDPGPDGTLPDWQWTPLPNATVLMNWRLSSPVWAGGKLLDAYRQFAADPGNYRELVLAERSNGDYGPAEEHIREIRHGLWYGKWDGVPGKPPRGTSLNQMLHLAGALGCTSAHSIGFELCIKDETRHHWYAEELYNEQASRKPHWPVVEYCGLKTFDWWIESAKWLLDLRDLWRQQGFEWTDYSDGLLQRMEK